jgi:hypothetical protein
MVGILVVLVVFNLFEADTCRNAEKNATSACCITAAFWLELIFRSARESTQ